MPSRIEPFREVYRMIQKSFCAKGMRRHSIGVYSRKITNDATGVVRLNTATKYGFSINPIIGVQYLPLECLLAQLKERDFHPTKCGDTIASPIGYLGPAHMFWEWQFEEDRDNAATVAAMVHEIATVGFRYMEENATLEGMCERIVKDRHFIMGSDVDQLPVGYMMLGRYEEAEEVVRRELEKIAAHKPFTVEEVEAQMGEKMTPREIEDWEKHMADPEPIPAHENYRRFAEAFFERLGQERGGGHHTGQVD